MSCSTENYWRLDERVTRPPTELSRSRSIVKNQFHVDASFDWLIAAIHRQVHHTWPYRPTNVGRPYHNYDDLVTRLHAALIVIVLLNKLRSKAVHMIGLLYCPCLGRTEGCNNLANVYRIDRALAVVARWRSRYDVNVHETARDWLLLKTNASSVRRIGLFFLRYGTLNTLVESGLCCYISR